MRVAYVTTYDPRDRLQWSGLGHAIQKCLVDAGFEVVGLGPLQDRVSLWDRLQSRLSRLSGKVYETGRSPATALNYARQVSEKLKQEKFDLVFCPGSIPISQLDCDQPIVIWADATFPALIEHYPGFENLSPASLRNGRAAERSALQRSRLVLFASQWAADSAVQECGADVQRVKVVPFGANFIDPPQAEAAIRSAQARSRETIELISVGVDWKRKGMDRSVALARRLTERGRPVRLTIVGCRPPEGVNLPDYVELSGFIDKREPEGERRLAELFQRSHFHVLFSEAECFGVVFCEANAYAVPNIASDVGGIPTAVVNGQGGWRFSLDSPMDEIADRVIDSLDNDYVQFAQRARQEYDRRLSWKASGEALKDLLAGL